MDYDGAPQGAPDIMTRGMWAGGTSASPDVRYYVNVYPTLTEDTGCTDGVACNGLETCDGTTGQCVAGTPPSCAGLDTQCATGTCVEPGTCVATPRPNGTPCDSGDQCSVPDSCQSGTCAAGGGGDGDADGVCNADDNCPTVASSNRRDLDGDGIGDVCDPADAALHLTRVKLRRDTKVIGDNGSINVKGDFTIAPPTDTFDATSGIAVRVRDDLALDRTFGWSASECESRPNRIKCRSADRRYRAGFRAPRATPTLWRFRLRFKGLDIAAPFQPPVEVTITHGEAVDRVGVIASCTTTANGLTCRAP
jgi:hypothetical protein